MQGESLFMSPAPGPPTRDDIDVENGLLLISALNYKC